MKYNLTEMFFNLVEKFGDNASFTGDSNGFIGFAFNSEKTSEAIICKNWAYEANKSREIKNVFLINSTAYTSYNFPLTKFIEPIVVKDSFIYKSITSGMRKSIDYSVPCLLIINSILIETDTRNTNINKKIVKL